MKRRSGSQPRTHRRIEQDQAEGTVAKDPGKLIISELKLSEIFASFKLGGTCALTGTVIQARTSNGLFAETEALGTFKVERPLRFSGHRGKAGGNLFTGANPAKVTGNGHNKLSGALAGKNLERHKPAADLRRAHCGRGPDLTDRTRTKGYGRA